MSCSRITVQGSEERVRDQQSVRNARGNTPWCLETTLVDLKRAKAHAEAASPGPNVLFFVTFVKEPIVVEMPRQVGVRSMIQAI